MRAGLTVSIIGHAVILGLGLVAFPKARPFPAQTIDALPVDLVSVADATDLAKGDKNSRILPKENPQPKPDVVADNPAPKETEKPTPKKADAAPPPPPPPPPPPSEPAPQPKPPAPEPKPAPKPEPAPEPKPAPAAEPVPAPEPKPAEEQTAAAAPQPPVDVPRPRARPNPPPKMVVKAKPEPKPAVQRPDNSPKDSFDPDRIAALLNRQDPASGGDPTPSPEPQTIGSIEGHDNAAMTQDEIAALKARLYQCWNPPVGVREAQDLVVTVRISLQPDGSLAGPPQIQSVSQVTNPLAQIAAEAALRAVVQCAPFGDILRPEKYALWNRIEFVFDPREMLGG